MTKRTTIEERKQAMFDAQAYSAQLARRIYEAERAGESERIVGVLIEQKAQAEATWLRLSQEVHAEVSSRNLVTFMERQEADTARVLEAVRGLGGRLEALEDGHQALLDGQARLASQISDIGEQQSEHANVLASFRESRDASIEQRRQHAEEIAQLHEHYRDLADQVARAQTLPAWISSLLALTDYSVITIDVEHRIIWANDEAAALFGYTPAELVDQPINLLIPERFHSAHEQHIATFALGPIASRRMAERLLVVGLHKDGTEIPIRAAISRQGEGSQLTFAVVLRRVVGA